MPTILSVNFGREFSGGGGGEKHGSNQQVLNPTPLNPTPATCHKRKRKLRCSFRKVALQKLHLTPSCAAASEKLHCNIAKAALQESGAFLPLSCGFQAPTFRHPRLGSAEVKVAGKVCWRNSLRNLWAIRLEVRFPRPSTGLGACAMTTKFLDNKICTFKNLLSWRFPRKQAFWDDFLLCPQGPPPPLGVKSLCLNCETKTFLLGQFSPILADF